MVIRSRLTAFVLTLCVLLLTSCEEEGLCDATCPEARCVNGVCTAAQCQPTDTLCLDGRVCDTTALVCSDCDDATPCPTGTCTEGRCVECERDADCGLSRGFYCSNERCVEGCQLQEHCPVNTLCDVAEQQCVECRTDADCGGNFCLPEENRCVECVADPGCGVGSELYCDTTTLACLPGCVSDISCPLGTTCDTEQRLCR